MIADSAASVRLAVVAGQPGFGGCALEFQVLAKMWMTQAAKLVAAELRRIP
jgi:hypothetical protein